LSVRVLGIAGPSCSGKSTVAGLLSKRVGAAVLAQDLYFIDPDQCPADANFCDLRYLHTEEFVHAATDLASGSPTSVPLIDFSTFLRTGFKTLDPGRILIIEGMTIFRIPAIAELCDDRFYLTLPFAQLAERKLARDAAERRKSREVIDAQLRWMREEHEHDLRTLDGRVEILDADGDELLDRIVSALHPLTPRPLFS
jgi:uridine kinase